MPLPKPPSSTVPPDAPEPALRIALPWAWAMLALAAAALAALLAWLADRHLGAPAWAAALGAVVGVVAALVPAAWVLRRLRPDHRHLPLVGGTLHSPLGAVRPLFLELAGREWARARRYGTGAALLLVDVDRFAQLNAVKGAGDAALAELLRQAAPTLRGSDLLTRFSSAQMAVFLAPADPTGALDVAERIRERAEALEVPVEREGVATTLRMTVSVGVAHLRPAHLTLQSLIDDAQDAVLAARQAGGNCVRAAPVDPGRLSPTGGSRTEPRARP